MSIFNNTHILLGVTGSIAVYKAADLASKLTQSGAQVDVILTPAAEKFITPLTFQSVTGRKAFTDNDLWGGEAHVLHVGLGHTASLMVIAPCTANTLASLASGRADNLLTITSLSADCPFVIAPAMDASMFSHQATRVNLEILRKRNAVIVGPVEGRMASGLSGLGRMSEPAEIMGHIRLVLGREGSLKGQKVVITAGGTQEPLDPVRTLTNKSSGKQGYALAQASLDAGASVVLITAPACLVPPVGARLVEARTAEEMLNAVLSESGGADLLLMAAAVADFRPAQSASEKLKKSEGIPQIKLEATTDILSVVCDAKNNKQRPRLVVGFAAESRDLLGNAAAKMKTKNLDMVVANDITAPDSGFAVDTNRVTLLFADGNQESLSLMSKVEVAEIIVERVAALLVKK